MVGVLCQVIRPRVEENVKCAKIFEEKERERKKETECERGREKGKEEILGKHAQRHFRVFVVILIL